MATVTGLTADRMIAIEAATVISGVLNDSGHLILTQHDGTEIDAGYLPDAMPAATTATSGVVELATTAETAALTDTTRAVTPAGLTGALKAAVVTGILETALPTAYPVGISVMSLSSGTGAWSLNSGNGLVITNNIGLLRCQQTFYSNAGGTALPLMWIRTYNSSVGGGGWTAWGQVMTMPTLPPTSATQAALITSYPQGQSRLYYSATALVGTDWDFAFNAKPFEIITYRDATDFGKQVCTIHIGGTANFASQFMYIRTYTSADGWAGWRQIMFDTQFNNLPSKMRSGVMNITAVANTVVTVPITFPVGFFTVPPALFTTANTSIPGDGATGVVETSASAVTTSGFNLSIYRKTAGSTGVWWLAVQN
jgi:hypothetical protein